MNKKLIYDEYKYNFSAHKNKALSKTRVPSANSSFSYVDHLNDLFDGPVEVVNS